MFGRKKKRDHEAADEATEPAEEETEAPEQTDTEGGSDEDGSDEDGSDEDGSDEDGDRTGDDEPALDQSALADVDRVEGAVIEPDDERKPESPRDLHKRSLGYVLRRTVREFGDDQCTDLAAALTYYSVLSIFPALLAISSILGVVGESRKAVDKILQVLAPIVSESTLHSLRPTLDQLAAQQSAGLTLVVGVLGALWSASGYVGAFGRAMNRIYEVREGRPFWKLRPVQLLVTVIAVLLCCVALVILIVSGPVAKSMGDAIGLGSTTVQAWNVAKWPVLALVVIVIVAMLYYATPNVRQPRLRWLSAGAFVAIVVWLAGSVGLAFYVTNFGSYNRTYGSLAGVVVMLLWLWLTNLALLFGAELDSELERGRELQAGMAAEEWLQLPVRDNRGIVKADAKQDKDVARARALREEATGSGDPADRPFARRR